MENKSTHIVELLKYPILVFSIVVAMVVLKHSLGLEFGMVTEFSTSGLKFSEKSNKTTLKAIAELESKLNEVTVKIAGIEKKTHFNIKKDKNIQLNVFSASQSVSDATANIAKLNPNIVGEDVASLIGYIWIGNYDGQWKKTTLASLSTGQPINITPIQMQIGTRYNVLGNMVVRDGLPPNNKEYYRARKNIGVIPRGNIISVLDKPESINREFAVQYWVKIKYSPK